MRASEMVIYGNKHLGMLLSLRWLSSKLRCTGCRIHRCTTHGFSVDR